MPGMRASRGVVRTPLARITNRARMASPRSVVTVQRPVCLVPLRADDLGVEEAVVVEAVPLGDPLAVLEDLEARRELHRREVLHLLEQRQVRCRTRRRRRCPDSGSSTTCRRRRRPSRRSGCRRSRPGDNLYQSRSPANPAPTTRISHSSVSASRSTGGGRVVVLEVAGELAVHRHVVRRAAAHLVEVRGTAPAPRREGGVDLERWEAT